MNRMRPSLLGLTTPTLLASSFAIALLALACDSGTQEPAPPTPAAPEATSDATSANDSVPAPSAREGEIDSSRFPTDLPEGVTAAVPDNFPPDVPIYPGSQPAQGKGIDIDDSPQSAVQFVTNDATADVHKFYSEQLAGKGWTIGEDTESERGTAIQASKGDCKTNILILPAEGGGSDIMVVSEC